MQANLGQFFSRDSGTNLATRKDSVCINAAGTRSVPRQWNISAFDTGTKHVRRNGTGLLFIIGHTIKMAADGFFFIQT